MEKKTNKYFYIVSIIIALLIIGITIGTSFAFFTGGSSSLTGTSSVITSGNLTLELHDGNVIGTTTDMIPGNYVTKQFSVTNTGSQSLAYDIYLSEIYNDFADKSDLVYSISSNDGGYNTLNEIEVPSETGIQSKIINTHVINSGDTQNYTLTIKFLSKNENQDDNKGKTFSAKIQINEYKEYVAPIVSASTYIANLVSGADTSSVEVIGTTNLAYDGTTDNNLRYVGSNPNNYVMFNDELWRIIGVFDSNTHGKNEELIKIVRTTPLEQQLSWDCFEEDSYLRNYNNWNTSSLNGLLNNGYYNASANVSYHNNSTAVTNFDMSSVGLDETARNMVEEVTWKTGAVDWSSESNDLTASMFYNDERGDNESYASTYDITSVGKVGLIYASDLLYAASGNDSYSRNTCLTSDAFHYNSVWGSSVENGCLNTSWIINTFEKNLNIWTMTVKKNDNYNVFKFVGNDSYGPFYVGYSRYMYYVVPSVYLKSSVKIVDDGNDGSLEHPYNLSI